MVVFNHI